jgi:hypothetical protein
MPKTAQDMQAIKQPARGSNGGAIHGSKQVRCTQTA